MSSDIDKWLEDLESEAFDVRWDALMHFLDHPDERAVEALVELALHWQRDEDEQYYAAEAVLMVLGEDAYVERFARAYESEDGGRRLRAISAIAEWAKEAGRDVLIEALEDTYPDVVALAVSPLSKLGDPSLADTIRPLTDHDHPRVRKSAVEAMMRLDPKFAAQKAIAELDSGDRQRRFNAAMTLVDNPTKAAVDALIARVEDNDEDGRVRAKCVEALAAARDPRGFDVVLAVLEADDEDCRVTAARQLGHFEDPRAIEPLIEYLQATGDDEYAHSEAAIGLGILGHPGAIPTLVEALGDDRTNVRQWACDALSKIEPPADKRDMVIDALLGRLEDEDSTVRTYAIAALGDLEAGRAADDIAEFLDSEERDERWRAAEALGNIGAKEFADGVADLADDHHFVQSGVARALGEIGARRHMPVLLDLLDEVPRAAAPALAKLGETAAIEPLVERARAMDDPEEQYDRVELYGAAARLGHGPSADALGEILLEGGDNAILAAIALVAAGDERGLDECTRQVVSDYWDTQLNAVWALGEYGEESARVALEIAREDPDEDVRAQAKEALAKLDA